MVHKDFLTIGMNSTPPRHVLHLPHWLVGLHALAHLKKHIQTKIVEIIPILVNYTFDCDNIFYNEEKEKITFIKLINPIDWENNVYTWTCSWETWNNSSTLKIEGLAIVEFQFHTRNRTNMAIRWCYENVLEKFKDNFKLTVI